MSPMPSSSLQGLSPSPSGPIPSPQGLSPESTGHKPECGRSEFESESEFRE